MTLRANPYHTAAKRTAVTPQIKPFGKTVKIAQDKTMSPDTANLTPGTSFRPRPRVVLAEFKNLLDFGCNEEYQLSSAIGGLVPRVSRAVVLRKLPPSLFDSDKKKTSLPRPIYSDIFTLFVNLF